jgi:hypothetical protein
VLPLPIFGRHGNLLEMLRDELVFFIELILPFPF